MKKSKLIAPCLIILGTLAFGIGETYALFTNKNENNIAITSGKVNLVSNLANLNLYSPTLIDIDGTIVDDTNAATTSFYNGGTATITEGDLYLENITPGDKASFKITFDNNSNIETKYQVILTDKTVYTGTETFKLFDALNIKVAGKLLRKEFPIVSWTKISANEAIDDIDVSVELSPTIGDDYQGLSALLNFSVEAIQSNAHVEDIVANCNISFDDSIGSITNSSFQILKGDYLTILVLNDDEFKIVLKDDNDVLATFFPNFNDKSYVFKLGDSSYSFSTENAGNPEKCLITDNVEIMLEAECCVAKGTKITMGDLTTKNVEDLRNGDNILAYNFFTGKFESTPLIYTFSKTAYASKLVVTLSNGNSISVVNDEDMFDVNDKKFFTVNCHTYKDIIGKEVLINNNGDKDTAFIEKVDFSTEYMTYYTLYSEKHINYVASDILMLYSVSGFNEKFELNDDLTINQEVYNADVMNYGLLTYDDVPNLDKDMFDKFDIATSSFLIGKGYITVEQFNKNIDDFIDEYTEKLPLFLSLK